MEQSESEAILRLKQGDIGGLETLVRRYQLPAVRTAYLITRDRSLAEDLVQAAFIRAYERIAQFESGRAFGPWFLRSVVNDALKAVTRRKDGLSLEQVWNEAEEAAEPEIFIADPAPGPEELLEQTETRHAIGQALNRLSPTQRATIVLRYYLGMSEAAIAEQLECPPGTVKWRLHAARQTLQNLLAELRPEPKPELKISETGREEGGKE